MTTTTERPEAPPLSPIEISRREAATTLRRLATRAAKGLDGGCPYAATLLLLAHIEPDALETAIKAHRFLCQDGREDLAVWGYVDHNLPGLLDALLGFIEAHYRSFLNGRWTRYEPGGVAAAS